MPEVMLNLGADAAQHPSFVSQATDPVVSNVATPTDFAAQFSNPLDQTEIVAMCEEIRLWNALPEERTLLSTYTWRELNELYFTSGSAYIAFLAGTCPEEYTHDGDNGSVGMKSLGAKKSLSEVDILHSMGSIAAGVGINRLIGGWDGSAGLPGGGNAGTFVAENIANLKEKEMRLGATLVMNGLDRLLAVGNASSRPLEFSGIETLVVTGTGGAHGNYGTLTGTFSATSFDRWLAEACAKPTVLAGHPQAIQEVMAGYFALGFANAPQQLINNANGNRITPGYNFGGEVNTSIGTLGVISDTNFTRTNTGGNTFQSTLFALRMTHNGEPLVYKAVQVPLAFKDLAPGCTSVSFEIWTSMALVIKALCAQGRYTALFGGNIVTSCPQIG